MTGQTIAHYYILEQIGAAGQSVVYKARDLKLDRLVMLKAIEIPGNDADAFASFQKEARAGISLNHPNISSLLDVIDENDGRYLIYEYLPGSSLREKLDRANASGELLPVDRSIDYILAVAHGLAEAHRHGIVHRDICPENVIVTPTHSVKITNFGKARLGDGPTFAYGGPTLVSAFSAFVPEQLQGAGVDHRCDIYCLAALLFELLTGEPPFKSKNAAARLNEIIYNPVPNMLDMRPGISNGLQRIVERGMAKKPGDRFPDMEALITELRAELHEGLQQDQSLPGEPAIAVLPFSSLALDPTLTEFCNGLTEEINYQLQSVEGLRVASSTSAARFRGRTDDLRKVGAHLNVNLLLEGSARAAAGHVRLILKLTDAASGYQVWSERFDRDLSNVLLAQDEIAAAVANVLRAKVRGETLVTAPPPPTGLTAQFNSAFATPSLDLAEVLAAARGLREPVETLTNALTAAKKLLEVRPDSVDAFLAAGIAHAVLNNPQSAEQALARALSLDPNRADARAAQALLLLAPRGDTQEAIALLRAATNPALEIVLALAWLYFFAGSNEMAIEQGRQAFKLDSTAPDVYLLLGRAYAALGQFRESLIVLGRGLLLAPDDARLLAATSYAHALSGAPQEANRIADELGAIAQKRYVSMLDLALPYAGQGLAEWVECCYAKARETGAVGLLWWNLDPAWKDFRKTS
jgi:serine/threonine protein kinase/Tfp pilus assembly protein PilF